MSKRDMTEISPAILIAAAALNADNTPPAVDLSGFDGCSIIISVGVGGITFSGVNKVEFKLTESDDDSTYTNVAAADIIGAPIAVTDGIIFALTAAHAAATTRDIGYKGSKRYIKLLADFSGTHGAATPISAVAIRGYPRNVAPA